MSVLRRKVADRERAMSLANEIECGAKDLFEMRIRAGCRDEVVRDDAWLAFPGVSCYEILDENASKTRKTKKSVDDTLKYECQGRGEGWDGDGRARRADRWMWWSWKKNSK